MELWIRSQDKMSLIKVSNLSLREVYHPVRHDVDCWSIGTYYDNLEVLGKYKAKERALEVLDEIEKLLKPILVFKNCECDNDTLKAIKEIGTCMINNNSHIEQIQTCIYEMPKE